MSIKRDDNIRVKNLKFVARKKECKFGNVIYLAVCLAIFIGIIIFKRKI